MKYYLFDIDGTLTEPRNKMTEAHYEFFLSFVQKNKVILITGSDYEKVIEQIGEPILKHVELYCCSGNVYYSNGILKTKYESVYLNNNKDLLKDIDNFIYSSKYKIKTGNHIEKRTGMLNISSIGRNATKEQRLEYKKWDQINKERETFQNYLLEKYLYIEVNIGGEISIDIMEKNKDKSQIVDIYKKHEILFFGDKCFFGGNDFRISEKIKDIRRNGLCC